MFLPVISEIKDLPALLRLRIDFPFYKTPRLTEGLNFSRLASITLIGFLIGAGCLFYDFPVGNNLLPFSG